MDLEEELALFRAKRKSENEVSTRKKAKLDADYISAWNAYVFGMIMDYVYFNTVLQCGSCFKRGKICSHVTSEEFVSMWLMRSVCKSWKISIDVWLNNTKNKFKLIYIPWTDRLHCFKKKRHRILANKKTTTWIGQKDWISKPEKCKCFHGFDVPMSFKHIFNFCMKDGHIQVFKIYEVTGFFCLCYSPKWLKFIEKLRYEGYNHKLSIQCIDKSDVLRFDVFKFDTADGAKAYVNGSKETFHYTPIDGPRYSQSDLKTLGYKHSFFVDTDKNVPKDTVTPADDTKLIWNICPECRIKGIRVGQTEPPVVRCPVCQHNWYCTIDRP